MNPQLGDQITLKSELPLDRDFNAPSERATFEKNGKIVTIQMSTIEVQYDRQTTEEPDPMPIITYDQKDLKPKGANKWQINRQINGVQTVDRWPTE